MLLLLAACAQTVERPAPETCDNAADLEIAAEHVAGAVGGGGGSGGLGHGGVGALQRRSLTKLWNKKRSGG